MLELFGLVVACLFEVALVIVVLAVAVFVLVSVVLGFERVQLAFEFPLSFVALFVVVLKSDVIELLVRVLDRLGALPRAV